MQRLAALLFLSILTTLCAHAQDPKDTACHFGSPEAAESLIKTLSSEKSCKVAAAKLHDCEWGSSADTQFAPIVVQKCEAAFYKQLSPAGKENYAQEMQLCAYEYARQSGTLSMSEAAMCQVDTAADFAAQPYLNNHPPARASFDCTTAKTLLEKAICSDIKLGHADIVLSRTYTGTVKYANINDKPTLIADQRQWLQGLPAKCHLPPPPFTQPALSCLRNEFELRFALLDDCVEASSDQPMSQCLKTAPEDDGIDTDTQANSSQRASFDCEAPSTAMEIAICADAELGQTDIKLSHAYQDAGMTMTPTDHKKLVDSERQWLRFVNQTCPLGAVGGIPPLLTRECLRTAFETRITQLQSCPRKTPPDELPCLNDFTLFPPKQ